jgi:hypothetical protein
MFDGWIERSIPNARRWAVVLFSIACYAFVAWHLLAHGYDLWLSGKRSVVLDLPLWIMPGVGGALSAVGLVLIISAAGKTSGRPELIRHHLSSIDASLAERADSEPHR